MPRSMKGSGILYVGTIPATWLTGRIKHVVSEPIITGAGEEAQDKEKDSIRYIRISDFDKNGEIVEERAAYIPKAKGIKYLLKKRAILAATAGGTVGKTLLYTGLHEPACYAGYLAKITTDPLKMLDRFLLYQMRCSIMDGFRVYSVKKSTIENISATAYSNMPIVIPTIQEQYRIVDFLDAKCSEIDALRSDIEKEIETLEEYKKSVITEAVTKGLDKNVEMKDSGIPWIPTIPKHWKVYRIADLYEDRNEKGNDTLPLLSVSINSGVSDKELSDEEQERVFLRSEDKSKYKRVYPGDITYNMMRAWQGAFGAVRVEGMVSPAYVVAKQTGHAEIDSRYIEALLRSPMGIEEMNRYSYGIMDFRKRLYWPQFRIIKVCLPDIDEQRKIADYIDKKSSEIRSTISALEDQLEILDTYKKSIIYEYVTGKKEVPDA